MPDNVQEVPPIDWSRLPAPLELEPPDSFDVPVVNLGADLLALPSVSHELWTERVQLLAGFALEQGRKVHEVRRLGRTVGVSLNGRGRAGIYEFALLDERELPSLVCAI